MENPYGENLPIFPTFYQNPTIEQLERTVERLVDRADKAYLGGKATEEQYNAWMKQLDKWSNEYYTSWKASFLSE